MQLTIHAIGDSAFLTTILNSIAMLAGTQDLRTAAGIGALVGLMIQSLRAILDYDGRGIRYGEFIGALLLWMALFQPTTTLRVEDAYSGEVRVVDHVPLGPAVSGAIVSSLGYGLTVLFETAFSVPSMTRHGYAGALETLTQVRRNLLSRLSMGKALNPTPTTDIGATVSQYVKDCTLTGVDLGFIELSTLFNTGGLPEAFRYDSEIYVTEIRDGTNPLLVSCTAAWPRLLALVHDQALPLLTRQIGIFMGNGSAQDPTGVIQSSLDALTQGQQEASRFILAAAMVPLFEHGVLGRHQDSLKSTQAAMVETAVAQRNTQWAAEQSLFARMVRPMLAWIEGFSYAITPIMTFTLLLGARGIKLCGQYTLMLIWIQFWMPILAIGNLYITLAAQGGFAALSKARFPLDSVAGIYQMDMELQNWLAVGGMLASATPAIALMLVYGGSVTATHFLGRMQGGDFIDEKVGAPNLVQSPAMIGMDSRYRHTPLSGVSTDGAEKVLPTFTLSQDQSTQESLVESRRERTSEAFMKGLKLQGSRSHGVMEEGHHAASVSQRFGSNASVTDRFLESIGEDLAQRYRESGLSGHDVATLIGGGLTGRYQGESLEKGKDSGGLTAGLSAQLQDRFHIGEGRAHEIAADLSRRITEDHGFQAELAQSVAKDAADGHRVSGTLGLRSDALGEVGRTAQAAVEAESAYQDISSLGHRSGTEIRIGALEAGQRVQQYPEHRGALDRALESVGLRGDAERLGSEWYQSGLINDVGQSYAAAGLALMSGHAKPLFHTLTADESVLGQTLSRTILGEAFHAPYAEKDLQPAWRGGEPMGGTPPDVFTQEVSKTLPDDPLLHRDAIEAESRQWLHQAESRISEGEATIASASGDAMEALKSNRQEAEHRYDAHRETLMDDALTRAADTGSPSEAVDSTVGTFLRASQQRLKILAEGGVEAFAGLIDDASKDSISPSELLKRLIDESPLAIEREISRWVNGEGERMKDSLTPAQLRYYKAALVESFGGFALTGDYQTAVGSLGEARKGLDEEAGGKAPMIATLLRKIASGGRDDLVGLLQTYNGRSPFEQR